MAILLITHDMGVIAETAQRVIVMYGAQVVEEAPVTELFKEPLHPYTQGLLRRSPDRSGRHPEAEARGDPRHGADAARRHQAGLPRSRCALAKPMHFDNTPPLKEVRPGHKVACFLY